MGTDRLRHRAGSRPRARQPRAGSRPRTRQPRAGFALALALAVAAAGTAGCGAGPPSSAATKPRHRAGAKPLPVVASTYPLSRLVSYVGGPEVSVVDLVPPGERAQGLSLSPGQRAELGRAKLVVDVGDGYQAQVEAAARRAPMHLSVLPAISKQARPYEFWLDPKLMSRAADAIARALAKADPASKRQFHNGDLDFQSVAESIESDFVNTFTTCPKTVFVTSDGAFGRMAADFGLVDIVVGTEGVKKAVAAVAKYSLSGVFEETGVPAGPVEQVARATRAGIKTLDPMEMTPAPSVKPLSYFSVMEQNLAALEGPLACDTTENFS
ncbi:MAG: metal ABC transporter substrate-binding protein [Acidimicrobiales bacterium]